MRPAIPFLILVFSLFALLSPFLPGEYDPFSIQSSTVLQLYSVFGLPASIPAILLLIRVMKNRKGINTVSDLPEKIRRLMKVYVWTNCIVLVPVISFTLLGLSRLLGIVLIIGVLIVATKWLSKITDRSSAIIPSYRTVVVLIIFPILLLLLQLVLAKPLTVFSRTRAMSNSQVLIEEIEGFHVKYGKYPPTLNGLWKDYKTGICGIEKYHYSNDDSTYNLYFEQPKFLLDQFGTREMVVYNPKDNHLMPSHSSWHILLEPHQLRATQGWYAAFETGRPHWKYFWFD